MFVYWAMVLSVTGMYTMYVTQLGFSKQEVSVIVTIYTLSTLIGQSFIGYIVDKLRRTKAVMLMTISMGIIVGLAINFAKVSWHFYILLFIWGFFVVGTNSLSEAWTIHVLKSYGEQRNFGKIRGFGSIGYGFSALVLGFLLSRFGWHIYSWFITLIVIITLIIIFMINDVSSNVEEKRSIKKEEISFKEAISQVFNIKPILVMIVIMFMYTFVMRGIYSYLGILVSDYGGGPMSLGFTYFFDASPEIITFFLTASLLKKYHSKTLIFVAFLLQIVRLIVILIFNNVTAIVIMGVFSGFAFGLSAASYKTYIYELAPVKYKASCMSISESIIGMSGVISAPIFGLIISKLGANSAVLFGLIIYIIVVVVMLKDIITSRKITNEQC
jgi:MFS transporter, PPP family, 3-phenylpropionic acid transporter